MANNSMRGGYQKSLNRDSNIELLKIIAIFIIVIGHFTQTLGDTENELMSSCAIDITHSTTNVQYLALAFFRHFGQIGNNIFFVCSAWFLVDFKRNNKGKIACMFGDVWTISIIVLVVVVMLGNVSLSGGVIIKCIFPTTFQNNWYITAYMIFYLLFPVLNAVIEKLPQTKHLSFLIISYLAYSIWCPLLAEWGASFYLNVIGMWVIIYFTIAYIKKYLKDYIDNKKTVLAVFLASIAGIIGCILANNFIGLHIDFFDCRLLETIRIDNIFLISLAISSLLLVRQLNIKSRFINRLSSLSLLIYIIHENLLLRKFYRPKVYDFLKHTFGYDNIILLVLLVSFVVFILSAVVSYFYSCSLQKVVWKIANQMYAVLSMKFNHIIEKMV